MVVPYRERKSEVALAVMARSGHASTHQWQCSPDHHLMVRAMEPDTSTNRQLAQGCVGKGPGNGQRK